MTVDLKIRLVLDGDGRSSVRGGLTAENIAEWAKSILLERGLLAKAKILDAVEVMPEELRGDII